MENKDKTIVILGLVCFLLVSFWVTSGTSIGFDTSVYTLLHMLPKGMADVFFKTITIFGNTEWIVVLVLVSTLFLWKRCKFHIIGISLLDICLNQSLKYLFARPRPSFEHLVHASGYSYPSGHTMIAIMLYGYFFYKAKAIDHIGWRAGIRIICVVLMLCVPLSRIYLGVHYATDIIGGVLVAYIALYSYIKWIEKHRENC